MLLGTLMTALLAVTPSYVAANEPNGITWREQHAHITVDSNHNYTLEGPFGRRNISVAAWQTQTASPLFDGLFALAQDDLQRDSVNAIADDAFDRGQAIPCHCFETGEKWHYVWTRDLSYAVDLGLWRFDPARAKASLRFKLSDVREPGAAQGLYVLQDTGSGGSWPISTDRMVWFLGARHLLGDQAFAEQVRQALTDTLAQDRQYVFDTDYGLYRGETSFLDWREQSYPGWTAKDVSFIAQSFALSTNVLHYEALRLAATLAAQHGDSKAADYRAQAQALKLAINTHFWRSNRGLYMSYIGSDGAPFEAYDLLGTALAITSGVAEGDRARAALANYPSWPAGSPVIWPERADQPIYHNRAIWPFVSAYALRAARTVNDPARIAHELLSLMRGSALAGSNMENFELTTQAIHVDDGLLSGPVVDSPRQLWSVAGYLDMVIQGVFGLTDDGRIEPKLPVSLVPMLFGDKQRISLQLPEQQITLVRPRSLDGDLLIAGNTRHDGTQTVVELKAVSAPSLPLRTDAALFAPPTPAAPTATRDGTYWRIGVSGKASPFKNMLYIDGKPHGMIDGATRIAQQPTRQCLSVTRLADDGLESLPGPSLCLGDMTRIGGAWPRHWTAPTDSRFEVALNYTNDHGPINTGITAAVKWLDVQCDGSAAQSLPLVMPHSSGEQRSTTARSTRAIFTAHAGARCVFSLSEGFNMSLLRHNAHYTGGQGGIDGALNTAAMGDLLIVPTP
ncbi:Six-hairpin glycosidase-like protein [Dyella tabacisoli]|uniref:Six-hairpin glycosidase-like protein n=1 Tax=Dyella tabacisoli TaxID=2282381 RepID=A0A369UX93_9GAMM|nr:Six-hairpin glycosidase-like protein [Dyella tabacisoli]